MGTWNCLGHPHSRHEPIFLLSISVGGHWKCKDQVSSLLTKIEMTDNLARRPAPRVSRWSSLGETVPNSVNPRNKSEPWPIYYQRTRKIFVALSSPTYRLLSSHIFFLGFGYHNGNCWRGKCLCHRYSSCPARLLQLKLELSL